MDLFKELNDITFSCNLDDFGKRVASFAESALEHPNRNF